MAGLWNRRRPTQAWTLERVFDAFPRLAERRASFSGSLSGGERQLLAIARAASDRRRHPGPRRAERRSRAARDRGVIVGTVGRLAARA
jgi:branched-chain amino acid transport system ATP-binding protein